MAFRGSGKSSIVSTAFAIWAILGKQNMKYVVIVAQTQQQAKQYMKNLKEELETNELLRKDLGPFEEDGSEWNSSSILLKQFGARITVVSVDQSIRGIRHKNHRPQLIIADDIENLQSMKTMEGRNGLYEWFTKELIPLGDPKSTRIILLGNMLHRDSLLMRMKTEIETGKRDGVFLRYPLVENGECIWPERFSEADIDQLRLTVGNETAWRTEYLLEEAGSEGQVVKPEWISWCSAVPSGQSIRRLATGIDLAISEEASADYTALVTCAIVGVGDNRRLYVMDVLERKMDFPTTAETIKAYHSMKTSSYPGVEHQLYVENVGYQVALVQYLKAKWPDMDIE